MHQCARSKSSNSFATDAPSLDYEVAELTWENGQLAMYGLGAPRALNKPAAGAWEKPRAADTLESIVDQATSLPHAKSNLVPWLDHGGASVNNSASAAASMDALVPCNNSGGIRRNDNQENPTQVPGIGSCTVGSCSGAAATDCGGCLARARLCFGTSYASASPSDTCGGRDSQLDSCERDFGGGGLTSTSMWSLENTSSGEDYTKTSGEEHDTVCRSRSQRQAGKKGNRKLGIGKSSVSAKVRAAAIHNQSERRRRDKINERMKTLQKLVPNSSKTDKASMLDEVIDYMKQLQAQVQMISRINMPSMMMPMSMQQHLQMSMMTPTMGMGMTMPMHGMGVMDINAIGRATGMPPMMPPSAATAFMPMPSWDLQPPPLTTDFLSNFFASQSQPMTMDGYTRLAALYQQFQQTSAGTGSKK